MDVFLIFIGVGNVNSQDLGNVCVWLLIDGKELLIDFGFIVYNQYKLEFKGVLEVIFIIYIYFDYIGGFQVLFFDVYFSKKKVILFVLVLLISSIYCILVSEENLFFEGGVNFWDVFNFILVSDNFWFYKVWFLCFQVEYYSY